MKLYRILFLFLICTFSIAAQEADIIPQLKLIEGGEKEKAAEQLVSLKSKYPNDPSVLFLQGVLEENGQDALNIYLRIVKDFPKSKYADAAVYRIYSYYFALGLYETAASQYENLKKNYPNSPYIKIAEREIPKENESTIDLPKESAEILKEKEKSFRYTIQAGAFGNLTNAKNLKKDFENSGFETKIYDKTLAGSVFHVVLVGKFQTEEEARNFLQVINTEFKLDGRVVEINPSDQK